MATGTAPPLAPSLSVLHLLARVEVLAARVRAMVEAVASRRPSDTSPVPGLYVTGEQVLGASPRWPPISDLPDDQLVAGVAAIEDAAGPGELRLRSMATRFGLTDVDLDLLVVALAPDLDPRLERSYGYLHDDLTRGRATVGLSAALVGIGAADATGRFVAGAPLVRHRLVELLHPDRPVQGRALRVADRVLAHLLDVDEPDPALLDVCYEPLPCLVDGVDRLADAIGCGATNVYVREVPGADAAGLAVEACRHLGIGAMCIDLARLAPTTDAVELVLREARLADAAVVAGPVELRPGAAGAGASADVVATLTERAWPVLLWGRQPWDPAWSRAVPLPVDVEVPSPEQRGRLWRARLGGPLRDAADREADGGAGGGADGPDPLALTSSFRLGPDQIDRAATTALLLAGHAGIALGPEHIRAGARAQSSTGLARLAERIEPEARLDDLVLPVDARALLDEVAVRARLAGPVYEGWGLRAGGRRGDGVTALFAGPSGTGKTMAAEAIAHELGLDLYAVDLSTIVDKYIGETEKNLERIFDEAEQANGVLFFDEADALFGKRSEVRDSHDRYANVSVAYLLQRMEAFSGVAVLATNLRGNFDEAFDRRIDVIVDFPVPDEGCRRRLWDRCLGTRAPRGEDLDLDRCASSFELTGGSIRNVVIAAAFAAADAGRPIGMVDLVDAVRREYRKLGLLLSPTELAHIEGPVPA